MSTAFKGLTITVGADTKQFNKEMKAVDRSIKDTNRQVSELQKGLELEFDAGRFAEAQGLAQKAISETEQKAQALREQLAYLESTGADTSSSSYQKLRTELVKTENQAVILKNKLQEIKDMKVDALAKQFENVGSGITKAGQALAPFSAAAAGVLVGLGAIGKATVESADNLATMAASVNLTAEELQRWQYIAMQTDVSNEDLQKGLTKTQGAFGSLAKGDIDAASKALLALGFTADQASNGMAANFDELVKRLSNIEDPILQAAYANELFGERMGAKLIPMLKAGGEGLAELAAEFENFGTLTEEQINSLAEFDNVMNKIKYSFKTIKDQIGAALLPVMQSLADFINSKVIPAVQKLTDWFTNLSDKQKNILVGALAFVAALAPVLMVVGKLTSGIGGAIKAFSSLSKVMGLLAAHPIIAVIGIIVALLATLYTTNEKFRQSINGLVSNLMSALKPVLDTIINLFNNLMERALPNLMMVIDGLIPVILALVGVIVQVVEQLAPFISTLIDSLVPILNIVIAVVGQLISALMPIITTLINALVPVIAVVVDIVMQLLGAIIPLVTTLLDMLMPVLTVIADLFGTLLGAIMPLVSTLIDALLPIIMMIVNAWAMMYSSIIPVAQTILTSLLPAISIILQALVKVIDMIKKGVVPVFEFLAKIIKTVFGGIQTFIEGFVQSIEDTINEVIRFINKVIDQINSLAQYVGITLGKLQEVSIEIGGKVGQDISVEYGTPPESTQETKPTTQTPSATDTIGSTPTPTAPSYVTNNDYSNKDIVINVTVENYAEEIDVDNLVRQVNLKLAESL